MRVLILTFTVLFAAQTYCQAQPPRLYKRSLPNNRDNQYWVHVPQDYDPHRAYPLMIVLQGKGGEPKPQYEQWNFYSNNAHYIMLLPRFFRGYHRLASGEDQKLMAMLREMNNEFRYDPDRVFMVGYSLGADFVQHFMFQHPGIVRAAAILEAENYMNPSYAGKGRQSVYFVGYSERMDKYSHQMNEEAAAFVRNMTKAGNHVTAKEFIYPGYDPSDAMKMAVMDFFKHAE